MNLNQLKVIYSKAEGAIILLDVSPETVAFGRRVAHQEVIDAIVTWMEFEHLDSVKINSHGKNYNLRIEQCK